MVTPDRRRGGMSVGGILVIAGVLILIFWSFWLGLIVALIGLRRFSAASSVASGTEQPSISLRFPVAVQNARSMAG